MSPYVSPDKKYMFFLSERDGDRNPYWVSTSVIDSLRQIVTSITLPEKKKEGIRILQIIKRPPSHEIIFRISMPNECQLSIDLFDLAGNLILAPVEKREYSIGIHEINVNLAGVPEGIYLYRFETGNMKTVTGKLLLSW